MQDIPSQRHLAWQCRRGLLELDEIFRVFLEQHYDALPDNDKLEFVQLLKYADQDLQQWIMYNAEPDEKKLKNIIRIIQDTHA